MSDAGADAKGALAPVERRVTLRCGRAQAFAAWMTGIGTWWPRGFSASVERLADVVIEARPGGRVFERDRDGGDYDWGTVRAYEAERRLLLAWTLAVGGDGGATEVELTFADAPDEDGGCELRFAHRGFSAGQEPVRAKFDAAGGWDVALAAYRQHAERLT